MAVWEQGWIEVLPGGVVALDQLDLLLACEVLELRFAGDGVMDVLEELVVDESVDRVSGGVCAGVGSAMGVDAVEQVVGYSDVEIARAAGEDVDVVFVLVEAHAGG